MTFLEGETFSATAYCRPSIGCIKKRHGPFLRALLPETGSDIKGQMQSQQQLMLASGYAGRVSEILRGLVNILDTELRLISPADPDGNPESQEERKNATRYYQLTHDYLQSQHRFAIG